MKRLIDILILKISIFIFLLSAFNPLPLLADTTIRVLLLDSKNSNLPYKNEKVERIDNINGETIFNGLRYPGIIEVWKGEKGLYVINEVNLEDYIKGVVAGEVGSNWEIEALKAQAVAARTYAIYQKTNGSQNSLYHITSSVLHQVYKGGNIPENISKAVNDTKGEILTYDGKPIIAYYHSTSGGITEDPSEVFGKSYPYLRPVETTCEISPFYIWEKRISLSDIEKATNINNIKDIKIDSYTVSNRVKTFKIISDSGEHSYLAKDMRKNLGWDKLPSTLITNITKDEDIYIFEGKGYGHGVGMCQWTALDMAKKGMNYREILSKFYPNTTIVLVDSIE